MSSTERTRHMDVTPEVVWGVLSDFEAISMWAPNVDHSCLLTGAGEGVGAQRRVQVGRSTLVETVFVWDPPTELSYSVEGLPKVVRSVVNTWQVRPQGSGVLVTLTSDIDAGTRPAQKVVARIVGSRLAAASEQMLAGMAEHLRTMEKSS
jgi:carbon monoxide dehydrogenase subunit G